MSRTFDLVRTRLGDAPARAARRSRETILAREGEIDRAARAHHAAPHRRRSARASTATTTSARCCGPATTSSSSTSRASPAGRCRSAGSSAARCATSPACCARSSTRARRRCATAATAPRTCALLERVGARVVAVDVARRSSAATSIASRGTRIVPPSDAELELLLRLLPAREGASTRSATSSTTGPTGSRSRCAACSPGCPEAMTHRYRRTVGELDAHRSRGRRSVFASWAPARDRGRSRDRRLNDWKPASRCKRERRRACGRRVVAGVGARRAVQVPSIAAPRLRGAVQGGSVGRCRHEDAAGDRVGRVDARLHVGRRRVDARRAARARRCAAPMAIYEVHLGSWMRVPEEGNRSLTLSRDRAEARRVRHAARLHARRADAADRAPVLRLVGLRDDRLLRGDARATARPKI